jgi:hypothetical protein
MWETMAMMITMRFRIQWYDILLSLPVCVTVSHLFVLICIVPQFCTTLYDILYCYVIAYIALYSIALYSTALYCIGLSNAQYVHQWPIFCTSKCYTLKRVERLSHTIIYFNRTSAIVLKQYQLIHCILHINRFTDSWCTS